MNLLCIPFLAFEMVIKRMETPEVFILSLVSSKTKNWINSIKFPTNGIWFDCVTPNEKPNYVVKERTEHYDVVSFRNPDEIVHSALKFVMEKVATKYQDVVFWFLVFQMSQSNYCQWYLMEDESNAG
uniref:F-box domain-containing protein n=1 Tax=Caenorhabditis tropicalis TaxID=1561998 RepID=A0A1I7UWX8_9PELO